MLEMVTPRVLRSKELDIDELNRFITALSRRLIEAKACPDLPLVAQAHKAYYGNNPNKIEQGRKRNTGHLIAHPDLVYRLTDVSMLQDLSDSGIVRTHVTADAAKNKMTNRWCNQVEWQNYSNGGFINVGTEFGGAVIVSTLEAAKKSWVTADKIENIALLMPDSSIVDLLDPSQLPESNTF